MSRRRRHKFDPNQMILPLDGQPPGNSSSLSLRLVEEAFQRHGWDYQLIPGTPPTLVTHFALPQAGGVLTSVFPDNRERSLLICAQGPENIPPALQPEVAALCMRAEEGPDGNGKFTQEGGFALLSRHWLPRLLNIDEVDHIVHPAVDALLRKANQVFPKIQALLTRKPRRSPSEDDSGLIF